MLGQNPYDFNAYLNNTSARQSIQAMPQQMPAPYQPEARLRVVKLTYRPDNYEPQGAPNVPMINLSNDSHNLPTLREANENPELPARQGGFFSNAYPKLRANRKMFWGVATMVRFLFRLRVKARQSRNNPIQRTPSASLFKTRLLEIMTGLHRVYLEPEGPIYRAVIQFVRNPNDLTELFDTSSPIYQDLANVVSKSLDDIVVKITEFMPKEGILGTTTKSAIFTLISEGNKFPANYFWDSEKERLTIDDQGKMRGVKRGRAMLLIMSAMVSRALITTLLIKPVKFRLLKESNLTKIEQNNLKLLATLMCYIVRQVSDNTDSPLKFPWEWKASLYSDDKMSPIYKYQQIANVLFKSRNLFRSWANEYITKLDEASGLKRV